MCKPHIEIMESFCHLLIVAFKNRHSANYFLRSVTWQTHQQNKKVTKNTSPKFANVWEIPSLHQGQTFISLERLPFPFISQQKIRRPNCRSVPHCNMSLLHGYKNLSCCSTQSGNSQLWRRRKRLQFGYHLCDSTSVWEEYKCFRRINHKNCHKWLTIATFQAYVAIFFQHLTRTIDKVFKCLWNTIFSRTRLEGSPRHRNKPFFKIVPWEVVTRSCYKQTSSFIQLVENKTGKWRSTRSSTNPCCCLPCN